MNNQPHHPMNKFPQRAVVGVICSNIFLKQKQYIYMAISRLFRDIIFLRAVRSQIIYLFEHRICDLIF